MVQYWKLSNACFRFMTSVKFFGHNEENCTFITGCSILHAELLGQQTKPESDTHIIKLLFWYFSTKATKKPHCNC